MNINDKIKDIQLSHCVTCLTNIGVCIINNRQSFYDATTQLSKMAVTINITSNIIALLFCALCGIVLLKSENYFNNGRKALNKGMYFVTYVSYFILIINMTFFGEFRTGLVFSILYALSIYYDNILLRHMEFLQDYYQAIFRLMGNQSNKQPDV